MQTNPKKGHAGLKPQSSIDDLAEEMRSRCSGGCGNQVIGKGGKV